MRYTLRNLMRKEMVTLTAYSSARSEYTGPAEIYLDANEHWTHYVDSDGINRYPDPLQRQLKAKLEETLGLPQEKLVIGNGSDELIDLLFRLFCQPYRDKALILAPTYGAYQVFADINAIQVSSCQLRDDFSIDFDRFEAICNLIANSQLEKGIHKLLFVCSPNNPGGTLVPLEDIKRLARLFQGIVVVDEAYYEFAEAKSAVTLMEEFPNIVVLRTFSKAWALAGARVGFIVAHPEIVQVLNKIKYPYNLSAVAQEAALAALEHKEAVFAGVRQTIEEREYLAKELSRFSFVKEIFPSRANFLLIRVMHAEKLHTYLREKGIIIRDRSSVAGCYGCLRVTVGTPLENQALLKAFSTWEALE